MWVGTAMGRAALLLLVFMATAVVWLRWGLWAPDLGAVWFGAKLYSLGLLDHIYSAPGRFLGAVVPDPVWHDIAAQTGDQGKLLLPYVYPPIVAAALSPLAGAVAPQSFFNVALIVMAACLAFCVPLARGIGRNTALGPWGWTVATLSIGLTSMAFAFAIAQLQPQIVVTTFILLAFFVYARGHSLTAGLILALAAAMKLTPAFFWLIFFYDRDWKAAGGTVLGGACLLGISLLFGGLPLHEAFAEQLQRASGAVLASPFSTSLDGVILALKGWMSGTPLVSAPGDTFAITAASPGLQAALRLGLVLSGLGMLHATRWMPFDQALPLRLLGLWALLILFGPLGWVHYLIGPLLLAPHLWGLFPRLVATRMAIMLAICCSALLTFSDIWIVPGLHLATTATAAALIVLTFRLAQRGRG